MPKKDEGSSSSSRMELNMWGGGWGLPSIDPESLQALATIRFGGAPATIQECNNPWKSPKGVIPFFKQINTEYLYSAHDIGLYLRSKNFSGDYGLTSIQCAETVAYGQLIWESLHVAYQYFFWVHEGNYSEVIRPFYGKRLPWIYKLWYPDQLRREAWDVVKSLYRDAETQPESAEQYIFEKAKKCVLLLTQKLGSNEFFMGTSSPTTLDAITFSYLVVFLKVQLPSNPIKEIIVANPHLERYLARILQRYFPVSGRGTALSSGSTLNYGPDGEVTNSTDENQFSSRQKGIAALVASVVMLIYALKNGMVRLPGNLAIESSHPDDDEDYWE